MCEEKEDKSMRPTNDGRESVECPYCGNSAFVVTGRAIYPHRTDLASKWFWYCNPCNAYVGCHGDTKKPLGRIANAELRQAKREAHTAFDCLWKQGDMKRQDAYTWLATKLGISISKCHIGMFDVDMCRQVIDKCKGG